MLLAGIAAGAQEWQDAYLFSQNNYGGTARSIGMGNAMTALGGDPGSLTFNPAGSSVASYSQFEITSGLSISSVYSVGTIAEGDTDPVGFGDGVDAARVRFKMPNVGYIVNLPSGRRHGLKSMSFGFVMNSTNDFTHRLNAAGVNSNNSFAASLASSADGYATDVMANEDWFYSGDASRMPAWIDMTGYRSGIISGVSGSDGAYIGLTEVMDSEGNFRLAAPVYQRYGRQTNGGKYDWIMNFSANWNDNFFLGANIGVTSLSYGMQEYWEESPESKEEFPAIKYSDGSTATFEKLVMKRNFKLEGSGLYAKVGALWVPLPGIRLGAAIQTPTIMSVTERYAYTGQSFLSGKNRLPVSSEEDYWGYDMTFPFRYNLGAAISFGQVAILSLDYEGVNYAHARFHTSSDEDFAGMDDEFFASQNGDIKTCLGKSGLFRAGVEFKPAPGLAIRTGYNYETSGIVYEGKGNSAVSFGLGYSSSGSFYADFSLRFRFLPDEYIIPYYYYYAPDPAKFYNKVVDDGVLTPEILVQSTVTDALFTVGWRF